MRTAESVRQQTYRDFEWIIIDGASTDGTADILKDMGADIIVSEPDTGVYNAMNKGIRRATGDYLLFMNGGDTFYSATSLAEAMALVSGDADVYYGDSYYDFPGRGERHNYPETMSLQYLYHRSICHQATFIRRELLTERGYDESLRIVSDWKRNVELFLEGRTFRHLPFVVSTYDTSGISSTQEEKALKEREQVLHALLPQYMLDVLEDWRTFQNKPCLQTRDYCEKSRLYRRIIRSVLHFITWLDR